MHSYSIFELIGSAPVLHKRFNDSTVLYGRNLSYSQYCMGAFADVTGTNDHHFRTRHPWPVNANVPFSEITGSGVKVV